MKLFKFSVIYCLLFVPLLICAQQHHFIYLQTEGKQPFYVRMDKKTLSSSVSGYLIIPRLTDGELSFSVGFPKSENAEQVFHCRMEGKDAGYIIKNFGEKGWGLFNLQTLNVVMAGTRVEKTEIAATEKTDEFATMLSGAVNDPSIKRSAPGEPAKKSPVESETSSDKNKPVQDKEPEIKKQFSRNIREGWEAAYTERNKDGSISTIEIMIPVVEEPLETALQEQMPRSNTRQAQSAQEPVNQQSSMDTTGAKDNSPTTENPGKIADKEKFLPVEMPVAVQPVLESTETKKDSVKMINSNCKSLASEEDFLKLRKKMAAEDAEDGMINVAQKFFRSRCYSTEQIKNLSFLFLHDAGKYRFFDLAYGFVYDSSSYGLLESQLTDSYYISRFKAMVRH